MKPNHSTEKAAGQVELAIGGMTCGGCASTVTRVLSRVPGVSGVRVDLDGGRALIEGVAQPEELVRAVKAAGYDVELRQAIADSGDKNERGHGCCCR